MPVIFTMSYFRESVVFLEREELLVLRVCRDLEVCLEPLEPMDPRYDLADFDLPTICLCSGLQPAGVDPSAERRRRT